MTSKRLNCSVSFSLLIPSAFLLSERGGGDGGAGGRGSGCGASDREEGAAVILNGQLCTGNTRLELTA